jgi:NPCBM/NEW2 domain/DNA/RNA non-specific endonuclease
VSPSAASNGWGPIEKDLSNGENQSGDGKPLSIRGVQFAKGLGVHANSSVSYPLNGNCTLFTTQVGIDDEVNGKGSVVFQIFADGTKLYDSGAVAGTDSAKAVSVDITGKTELKLVVDSNGSLDYDHADWADAKLTCAILTGPVNIPDPQVFSKLVPLSGATDPVLLELTNDTVFKSYLQIIMPSEVFSTLTSENITNLRTRFAAERKQQGGILQTLTQTPTSCKSKFISDLGIGGILFRGQQAFKLENIGFGRVVWTARLAPDWGPPLTPARDGGCTVDVAAHDGRDDYDGGHLVGFDLGGFDGRENLVPQPRSFNRGTWNQMDSAVKKCISRPPGNTIFPKSLTWSIWLSYGDPLHPVTPTIIWAALSGAIVDTVKRTQNVFVIGAGYPNIPQTNSQPLREQALNKFRRYLYNAGCQPATLKTPTFQVNLEAPVKKTDKSDLVVSNDGDIGSNLIYNLTKVTSSNQKVEVSKSKLAIFGPVAGDSLQALSASTIMEILTPPPEDIWANGQLVVSKPGGGELLKEEEAVVPTDLVDVRLACQKPDSKHIAYVLMPVFLGARDSTGAPIVDQKNFEISARCTGPLIKLDNAGGAVWDLQPGQTASLSVGIANRGVKGVKYADPAKLEWTATQMGGSLFNVDQTKGSLDVDKQTPVMVTATCPQATTSDTMTLTVQSNDTTQEDTVIPFTVKCGKIPPHLSYTAYDLSKQIAPGHQVSGTFSIGNCFPNIDTGTPTALGKARTLALALEILCEDLQFTIEADPALTISFVGNTLASKGVIEIKVSATCTDVKSHLYPITIRSNDPNIPVSTTYFNLQCLSPRPNVYLLPTAPKFISGYTTEVEFVVVNDGIKDVNGDFTPLEYSLENDGIFKFSKTNGRLDPQQKETIKGTVSCINKGVVERQGLVINGKSNADTPKNGDFIALANVICWSPAKASRMPMDVYVYPGLNVSNGFFYPPFRVSNESPLFQGNTSTLSAYFEFYFGDFKYNSSKDFALGARGQGELNTNLIACSTTGKFDVVGTLYSNDPEQRQVPVNVHIQCQAS